MANSVDPAQTAPIGAGCVGSKLFASILYLLVMLGNCLQQMTSADNIFRCIFFLGALRVKTQTGRAHHWWPHPWFEAWSPVRESRDMLLGWKCIKHIISLAPRSHRHLWVGILLEHLLLFI